MTHVEEAYTICKKQVRDKVMALTRLCLIDTPTTEDVKAIRSVMEQLEVGLRRADMYRLLNDIRTEKLHVINNEGVIIPVSFS